ncbi:MAG: helix-turn-helix domain-containing protein [Peptostreptococcaceae bacterium]|nr:helix-turn-helix domain-containing protein [Peptostreptococcaceae bacterium]
MMKLETKHGIAKLPVLLSPQDVRKYLRIRTQSAYNLFEDNSFPSKKIGNSRFVTEEDFKEYLRKL